MDRLTGNMLDFAERKFGRVICDAWEDFNQVALPPPYEQNVDEKQIFLPYFLFEWAPSGPRGIVEVSCGLALWEDHTWRKPGAACRN